MRRRHLLLSRYARANAAASRPDVVGRLRLGATEQGDRGPAGRDGGRHGGDDRGVNIYRAANAVRNHLERTVLAERGLTWTGWVVLWVIWIWGEVESRHVAEGPGSQGTLTGVQNTLMAKGPRAPARSIPGRAPGPALP